MRKPGLLRAFAQDPVRFVLISVHSWFSSALFRVICPRRACGHMVAVAVGLAGFAIIPAVADLYTDTGSPVNPPWSEVLPTLNDDAPDNGPVPGSVIDVNQAAVEIGLYGNRPVRVGTQKIHVCCNTSVSSANFTNFTRWYQTDGNTQVFRLFAQDENTANTRVGAARCEAFTVDGWNYTNDATHEWTGRFTIARRTSNYSIFQVFNDVNEWAVQLNLSGNGSLTVNNRWGTDVVVTNSDGSAKNFDGIGFDVRVRDDGRNYKVWIDGVLWSDYYYPRETGETTFRWGTYCGSDVIPTNYSLILVSGAQVQSWPGNLDAATTATVKANNTTNLDVATSWVGGAVPGLYNQAVWDSTVSGANTTTLGNDQTWAGIKVQNPGGLVTINGSSTLGLDAAGLDLGAATQNLVVNCPVELTVSGSWTVAAARMATFNGSLRGYAGLTVGGGGTVRLNAVNTFTGPLIVNAGTLSLARANAQSETTLHTGAVLRVADSGAFGAGGLKMVSNSGATGRLELSNNIVVLNGRPLALPGRNTDTDAIRNVAGSNTLAAPISFVTGGVNYWIQSDAGLLTLAGAVKSSATGTRTLTLRGEAAGIVSGVIENGSSTVAIAKADGGTWTLSGSNTYSGGTSIGNGIVQVANAWALGSGAVVVTGGTRLVVGHGLVISNAITIDTNRGVVGRGLIEAASDAVATLSGPITIDKGPSAGGHFASTGTGVLHVKGPITSSAPVSFRSGSGVFSGGGSYSSFGATGHLKIGTNNGICVQAVMDLALSGTGTFDLNGFDQELAGLMRTSASSATVTNSGALKTLTLNVGGTNACTYGGVIAGPLVLTKSGGGSQTLTNTNTYSGGTLVEGGRFNLVGSLASPVVVSSGVFQGAGIVNHDVIVSGGTNAPGASAGILTVKGNYTLQAGGALLVEINGLMPGTQHDQIRLTSTGSTVTLAGRLHIDSTNALSPGASFVIISNSGSAAVIGAFADLPQDAVFASGGQWWRVSYTGGNGNDVALTALPPNTAPVLAAVSNCTIGAGQTLWLTNTATDADLPAQTLTFGLLQGPTGASINASSGVLSWRPAVAQADSTNLFRVQVADDGTPILSATQQFIVVVGPLAPSTAEQPAVTNGHFQLTITGDPGPDYSVQASSNLVDWSTLFTTSSPALPFSWADTNGVHAPRRFYRAEMGP